MCILELTEKYMYSDELQFGFKKGIGCSDALVTASSAIKYFTDRGCTVTACVLDLSKAFDKVNFHGLLTSLMSRRAPRCVIDILHSWYSRCEIVVRWGLTFSATVKIKAGVRQGGVLSPFLFSVYIDILITKLRNSGLGLYLHRSFIGCILYADDVMLLACSLTEMQRMLNICSDVIGSLDMKFNAGKSFAIRFGKRYKSKCAALKLDGCCLEYADKVSYLGMVVKSGMQMAYDFTHTTASFYRSFNKIWSKCSRGTSEAVGVYVMQSICVPTLTYGFDVLGVVGARLDKLENALHNAIRKMFAISNNDNVAYVMQAFGVKNLAVIRKSRVCKFLNKFACKYFSFGDIVTFIAVRSDRWLSSQTLDNYFIGNSDELRSAICNVMLTCNNG
jgi:hypothetical protein